jgi:hypothetical protein
MGTPPQQGLHLLADASEVTFRSYNSGLHLTRSASDPMQHHGVATDAVLRYPLHSCPWVTGVTALPKLELVRS